MKRVWVTAVAMSLQASLSLAADIPLAVTHSDFPTFDSELVLLGRDLFFDPILSGNRNIACATCHHPRLGSGDGVSLAIGQGGSGLGPDRKSTNHSANQARIPRNAPALWNLGAYEFTTMFHDGRVTHSKEQTQMPPGRALERPLPSALAAQNILPVLSPEEMAGHPGENPIADAVARDDIQGKAGAWALIAARVDAIPVYRQQFEWLRGSEAPVHITEIGRALSAYIGFEFRATNSPFDAYLAGDDQALDARQKRGMTLFYGRANCDSCHSGPFQTDHGFHAIGIPQFGPGKKHADKLYADMGRFAVTQQAQDRYRFRTPSLRNVTLSAPYGHNGAYPTLGQMLDHHLDPIRGIMSYDPDIAELPPLPDAQDWQALMDQSERINIAAAIELAPISLTPSERKDLLAFLAALTDHGAARGRLGLPETVPSGLPIDR